ncbi:hypothetical protein SteCoe_12315 [Stentor coeruleus]|uniref:Uncharacterized protein n=1 Tax=Stentor coeruleus TaxID=5963 RepID=A0A1R2CBA4_9CILI|nr:hypothetical protein SteCoe_12315 [Stentor coeruleus]
MEGGIVLETPDVEKIGEEVLIETRPKVISKYNENFIIPAAQSIQEKLEFFKNIYGKKIEKTFSWEKKNLPKNERLKLIEKELEGLTEETEAVAKSSEDYDENIKEIKNLQEKLKKIKINSEKAAMKETKAKLKFPKPVQRKDEGSNKGIKLEVDISNFKEMQRMNDIHNKITELENVIGSWEDPQPVCKSLADFLLKTYFLNENTLEKIKEHARHLSNDLDSMLSNSSLISAAPEVAQLIERLHDETIDHISKGQEIPLIIDKLKIYQTGFLKSFEVSKSLQNFEETTSKISKRIDDSLECLHEIKDGIASNKKSINSNIQTLKKKLI